MPAKIQIRNNQGLFDFVFTASNNEPMLFSDKCRTEIMCLEAARALIRACTNAHNFEKKDDPNGQYYFVIRGSNAEALAASEKFWSATSRNYAMMIVKREMEKGIVIE